MWCLVLRLMKTRGFKLDEPHTYVLLRVIYNHIRSMWVPGGYPPNSGNTVSRMEGALKQRKRKK